MKRVKSGYFLQRSLFVRQSGEIKGKIAGKNRQKQPKLYVVVSAISLMRSFAKVSVYFAITSLDKFIFIYQ